MVEAVLNHQESERILEGVSLIFSLISFNEGFTIKMVELNCLAAISVCLRSSVENTLIYTSRILTNISADG